jgi:molybdopterin-binding protein
VDISTVFVTHDRSEAQVMGDRLAVMIDGQLRQVGRPEDVFAAPADEQVAEFVGVENIVRGRVAGQDRGAATIMAGDVPISVVGDFSPGDELIIGIRPEAVILELVSRENVLTSALNRLPGTVTGIVHMGTLARVRVDCGVPLVSLVTGQSVENLSLSHSTAVLASFKASAIQVIRHITRDAAGPPAEHDGTSMMR